MSANLSVTVDFGRWGPLVIAPGQPAWIAYTWTGVFDGLHWARFSGIPGLSVDASVQIVEEWASAAGTVLNVVWKNSGTYPVLFYATAIVAPSQADPDL